MSNQNPILVTGSHRSGTTWVGRMLASSPKTVYFHEPFNLYHDPGTCKARFENWFTYVCRENEHEYADGIRDTINFRYNLTGKLKAAKHRRHVIGKELKTYTRYKWYGLSGKRALLKDPIALFSAEWLSSRFKTRNVVLIRHPAAFAGSLKEKNWTHPFEHFLNQPLLIKHHLHPFEKKIREFANEEKDIIDQAALLWNLIHYMILKFKEKHPDWIYLRHEDLSRDPVNQFRELFESLNLPFSQSAADTINSHSFTPSTPDTQGTQDELKRDSLANIQAWKTRLTPPEIDRLYSKVHEISKAFYTDDTWL